MPDAFVHRVDDGLTVGDHLIFVIVKVEDPVQGLLRRSDVVAHGTEHDDWRLDVAQVDPNAVRRAQLAAGELIADEQLIGDPLHLLGIEQDRVAPPLLESEEPRRFSLDVGIQVIELLPVGVRRVHILEVLDQIGAVETTISEIAAKRCQPGTAEQPAGVAHRRLAVRPRPVGQRLDVITDAPSADVGHHVDQPCSLLAVSAILRPW